MRNRIHRRKRCTLKHTQTHCNSRLQTRPSFSLVLSIKHFIYFIFIQPPFPPHHPTVGFLHTAQTQHCQGGLEEHQIDGFYILPLMECEISAQWKWLITIKYRAFEQDCGTFRTSKRCCFMSSTRPRLHRLVSLLSAGMEGRMLGRLRYGEGKWLYCQKICRQVALPLADRKSVV